MGITFKSNASPADVSKLLKAAAARARNIKPVLIPASIAIKKLILDSFNKGTTPEAVTWAPLSQATLKLKRTSKIGIETGKLLGSVYSLPEGNGVRYGATAAYAAAFNNGSIRKGILAYRSGSRPAGTPYSVFTPARSFMPSAQSGPSQALFQIISNWVGTYITHNIKPQ